MQSVVKTLRTVGIVIGIAFIGLMLWVAVIGPAILLLVKARS